MSTITITITGGYEAVIAGATFEIKDELRRIGGKWDPDRRVWLIPADYTQIVERLAIRLGMRVDIDDQRKQRVSAPARPQPGVNWAASMFQQLPDRLHEPVYRALVRVLHPDIGGDRCATQLLNDAHADRQAAKDAA